MPGEPDIRLLLGLLAAAAVLAAIGRRFRIPDPIAFALGAIAAPPDSVAAKAIADFTLRLPRRIVAILSGEGLVTDAVALIAIDGETTRRLSRELDLRR